MIEVSRTPSVVSWPGPVGPVRSLLTPIDPAARSGPADPGVESCRSSGFVSSMSSNLRARARAHHARRSETEAGGSSALRLGAGRQHPQMEHRDEALLGVGEV